MIGVNRESNSDWGMGSEMWAIGGVEKTNVLLGVGGGVRGEVGRCMFWLKRESPLL